MLSNHSGQCRNLHAAVPGCRPPKGISIHFRRLVIDFAITSLKSHLRERLDEEVIIEDASKHSLNEGMSTYVGVVEWLRRSVSHHASSTRVGSNPVVGTTNPKPTVNSALHPFEVGKRVLRSNSEGTSTGHTLITASLNLKCFIRYKDSKLLLLEGRT